jgi:hypothetical protein
MKGKRVEVRKELLFGSFLFHRGRNKEIKQDYISKQNMQFEVSKKATLCLPSPILLALFAYKSKSVFQRAYAC